MHKKKCDDGDLREKAMALRHKGYSYREIAKELGCSLFKVSDLISAVEQPESRLKKFAEIDERIKDLNSNLNVVSSWVADINRRMPDILVDSFHDIHLVMRVKHQIIPISSVHI